MAKGQSGFVSTAHTILKLLAIVVGLPLTTIALMGVVGYLVEVDVWLRAGVAGVIALLLPVVVANFLLPSDGDQKRSNGIVTDVLAVCWLGAAVLWLGIAAPTTRPLVDSENARLRSEGYAWVASGVDLLVGDHEVAALPTPPPAPEPVSPDAGIIATAAPDAGAEAAAEQSPAVEEPPPAPDQSLTPAELFVKMSPAVVSIKVIMSDNPNSPPQSGGTGFLIDDKGTIATNHHVIHPIGKALEVMLHDGSKVTKVSMLAADERLDLALLRIDPPPHITPLRLGDSDAVIVSERVVSIGNPLGLDFTLTDGIVSARRVWRERRMIQMSAPVSPGNSGGPLFDASGDVIGITTAGLGNAFNRGQNLNLAVPINELQDLVKDEYPGARIYGEAHGQGRW